MAQRNPKHLDVRRHFNSNTLSNKHLVCDCSMFNVGSFCRHVGGFLIFAAMTAMSASSELWNLLRYCKRRTDASF